MNSLNIKKQKAFTLIEVMIAVVVFSFGLLGIAGVMAVSVKSNHNGYMRSQATFLAHSMADMMRKNSWSVWNGNYNGAHTGFTNLSTSCNSSACGCAAVATRDTAKWANMITQTLSNGAGNITCADSVGTTYGTFTCSESDQPYLGLCTITVTWDESNYQSATSGQTVTLITGP